jgi:hypothetical protein
MAIITVREGLVQTWDHPVDGGYGVTYCRYCEKNPSVKVYEDNMFVIGCECSSESFSVCSYGLGHVAYLWNNLNYRVHGKSKYSSYDTQQQYKKLYWANKD